MICVTGVSGSGKSSLVDATLRRALERTTQKRGSGMILTDYPEIMKEIRESDTLRKLWEKYSRE